jgi:thioredoxin 2
LPWVTSADDAGFERVADRSSLRVLVDLWAPWCKPCAIVEPGVAKAAQIYAGRLKVVKVDVDTAPAVADRFAVRSIPMLLLLDKGAKRGEQVGAVRPDELVRWVGASLTRHPHPGDAPPGSETRA